MSKPVLYFKVLVAAILAIFTLPAVGQDCYFKPDSKKILNNENLDFFLGKLKSDRFTISRRKEDIPKEVRQQLTCLIGDSLLANPNEKWNPSDVLSIGDVRRQLVFSATGNDICVIVYRLGGFVLSHKLILMRFNGKKLVDLWSGYSYQEIVDMKHLYRYLQENKNNKGTLNYTALSY